MILTHKAGYDSKNTFILLSMACTVRKPYAVRGSISGLKYFRKNITTIDKLFKIIENYQHTHRK
jgi:hypothetical protein